MLLLKAAADGKILVFEEAPLVSTDFIGSSQSSTVDAALTMVIGDNMVKIILVRQRNGLFNSLAETTLMIANKLT